MRLRVSFYTLGCKLNQLETESIADAFARSGAEVCAVGAESSDTMDEAADTDVRPKGRPADLVIVNTCTVTGRAEQKARRIVRQVSAEQPEAAVIITGCYAQLEAEAAAALGGNTVIVSGDAKGSLLGLPLWLEGAWAGRGALIDALHAWKAESLCGGGRFAFEPAQFTFHSRPYLKVQDGCDNRCSYCRVCIARGPSVSLDPDLVVARARSLEKAGKAEIVLTGVNLSQYRWENLDFPGLMALLVAGTERVAFRLSSYEPDRIDDRFLEIFAHPRLRPHLHLAVQSGADPVLRAMGRRYRREDVSAAVRGLRSAKGDLFIGADIIVGFPGETEDDAAATFELAESCEFAWIHAFRFSPRPGTQAARLGHRVPERIAGERSRALTGLARRAREAYVARWLGSLVEAVIEAGSRRGGGDEGALFPQATSANYLKLRLRALPTTVRGGDAALCRIESMFPAGSAADASAVYLHAPR